MFYPFSCNFVSSRVSDCLVDVFSAGVSLSFQIDPSEGRVLCMRPSAGPCCPGDVLPALLATSLCLTGLQACRAAWPSRLTPVSELLNLVYLDISCCHLSRDHGRSGPELHTAPGLTCRPAVWAGSAGPSLGVGFQSRCGWSACLQGGCGEGSASRSCRRLAVRPAEGPVPFPSSVSPGPGGLSLGAWGLPLSLHLWNQQQNFSSVEFPARKSPVLFQALPA